jgi:hypothetical protein
MQNYVYINFNFFNKNMCMIGSSVPNNKKKMHHDYAIKSFEHFYFCFQILMLVKYNNINVDGAFEPVVRLRLALGD